MMSLMNLLWLLFFRRLLVESYFIELGVYRNREENQAETAGHMTDQFHSVYFIQTIKYTIETFICCLQSTEIHKPNILKIKKAAWPGQP